MPTKIFFFMILLMGFAVPSLSFAVIVGSGGATYPIKERDMLEVIEERIATIDQEEFLQKLQDSIKAEAKVFRPKDAVSDLAIATKDRIFDVDLTYTVSQDVVDMYGKVIYPKGHTVNPLVELRNRGIPYPFVIVVLNAERKEELEWFRNTGLNDNPNVKLWISNGHAYELGQELRRPVYYLTQFIQKRFMVTETPTLIYWPQVQDYLKVKSVAVSPAVDKAQDDSAKEELEAIQKDKRTGEVDEVPYDSKIEF